MADVLSGLPNTFGDYDETPAMMAMHLKVRNTFLSVLRRQIVIILFELINLLTNFAVRLVLPRLLL